MKFQDIKKMNEDERRKKLEELKFELIKSQLANAEKGSSRKSQIRKTIAKIHTINKLNSKNLLKKK